MKFYERISLLLLLMICFPVQRLHLMAADDKEISALSESLANRGDIAIRYGEFRYVLDVSVEVPSSQEITDQVKLGREALRMQMERNKDNPRYVKNLQKAIDSADQTVSQQMRQNASVMFQFYFALSGPELGGDRYMEISTFDRAKNAFGETRKLLLRSQGAGRGASVDMDPMTRMVIVGKGRNGVFLPSQEPHRLGRASGSLPHLVSDLDAAGVKEWLAKSVSDLQVTPVTDEQGVEKLQLEFKVTVPYPDSVKAQLPKDAPVSNTVSMVYHIVPSRGFITPLIRETDPTGQVIFEWISSDYFQPAGSDLWFPLKCESRTFMPGKKEPRVERYTFEKDGVQLNHKIPDERFAVSIPPKTTVIDATGAVHKNYVTTRQVALTIDDVARLSQLDGIAVAPEPVVLGPPRVLANNPARFWLFWGNVVVLCGLTWWLIKRQAKQPPQATDSGEQSKIISP